MVECQKCLDPTSLGLFFVAVVSLPLALVNLWKDGDAAGYLGPLLEYGGILILVIALLAYRSDSNFGFVVFGLVGFGVFMSGLIGLGFYGNLVFAIVYILAIVWSIFAKTPKSLSLILVTTALIFLFGGIGSYTGDDIWTTLCGVAALVNFLLSIYLAFALALEDKLPVI